ncbi:MAG: hypothetical protein JNK93_09805, partial [Planctomycetia bacterium]|nr:hypothetical protein [Planctomycetia bacterium]
SRIADGTLLRATYFRRLDCDAALDVRDSNAEFVAEWVREFERVGQRWAAAAVAAEARGVAEDIRRESFLAVSRATRQHEIASYVSDDFDLIVRGRLIGAAGGLLGQLWTVYDRGEFPQPPLGTGRDAEPFSWPTDLSENENP